MPSQILRNLIRDILSNDGDSLNAFDVIDNITAAVTARALRGTENYGDDHADDPNAYHSPTQTTRSGGSNAMTMVFFVLFTMMTYVYISNLATQVGKSLLNSYFA